ncbi:MAG: hypothetical protein V2A67_09610 [Bacteroidota bacterium]
MSLHIESTYPLWLVLPLATLAVFVVWLLYFRKHSDTILPKPMKILLGITRGLVILITGILFISPWIRTVVGKKVKPVFIIARDNSVSMSPVKDSAATVAERNTDLAQVKEALEGNFTISEYLFGDQTRPGSDWNYSDPVTRPDELFETVRALAQNQDVAGMLVVTDGAVTRGTGFSGTAKNLPLPVYFLGTGDTTRFPDVSVVEVIANEWVRKNSVFQVRVYYRTESWIEKALKIRISGNQGLIAEQQVPVNDQSVPFVDFEIQAPDQGIMNMTTQVIPFIPDKNTENNSRSFRVNIIGSQAKILLLYKAPDPDIGTLDRAMSGLPQVSFEAIQVDDFKVIPEECNLLILHGLPSADNSVNTILTEAKARSLSVLFIISANTDQELFNQASSGLGVSNRRKEAETVQGTLSPTFSLFTLPEEFSEHLLAWPPLETFFEIYSAESGSVSFLNQKIRRVELTDPLILFTKKDGVKKGIIAGEGIWKWRIHEYLEFDDHGIFDELISRMLQYLIQDDKEDRFIVTIPDELYEFSAIRVIARLQNPSLESVNQPDVNMRITDSAGQTSEYRMRRVADFYELELNGFEVGEYQFIAETQLGQERFSKKGSMIVGYRILEQKVPVAEYQDLRLVSYLTGGHFYKEADAGQLISKLKEIKPGTANIRSEYKWYDLINLPWLLGMLVFLLALEWFLRRWYGTR